MNPANYSISTDKERLNVPWILKQLHKTHWGGWYTIAQLLKAIDHSLCFGVYDDTTGCQVGFARVVTDGAAFSAVMDVFIEEPLRGFRLGERLMEAVVAHPLVSPTISILSTRDAHEFYKKFDYLPLAAMQRDPR